MCNIIAQTTIETAKTKDNDADIINIILEKLIKRYGVDLNRLLKRIRNSPKNLLSQELKEFLDKYDK